jgi:hypothetical protein
VSVSIAISRASLKVRYSLTERVRYAARVLCSVVIVIHLFSVSPCTCAEMSATRAAFGWQLPPSTKAILADSAIPEHIRKALVVAMQAKQGNAKKVRFSKSRGTPKGTKTSECAPVVMVPEDEDCGSSSGEDDYLPDSSDGEDGDSDVSWDEDELLEAAQDLTFLEDEPAGGVGEAGDGRPTGGILLDSQWVCASSSAGLDFSPLALILHCHSMVLEAEAPPDFFLRLRKRVNDQGDAVPKCLQAALYLYERCLIPSRGVLLYPCMRKFGNGIDVRTTSAQEGAGSHLKKFMK